MGVLWGQEPSLEDRRLHLLSGFIRRLRLELGSPLMVKLDLAPLDTARKKRIDRNEAGWDVNYHHDDWLLVEGRLEGSNGVAFRYTRAESQRRAVHVQVRGNTRITRTRTEGWFHDAVALRFAPDAFPGSAQLGPDAYQKLKLPQGFETKHFVGQPGVLELTVTSDRKWDAGPAGANLDGGDAVKIAGLWLTILFDFLGAISQPFQADGDLPPSPTMKLPVLDGPAFLDGVTHPAVAIAVLGLPGLLMISSGVSRISQSFEEGDRAARLEKEAKSDRDPSSRTTKRRQAKWARDSEVDYFNEGVIKLPIGLLLVGAGAGGGVLGYFRRKKKKAAAEAAPMLPPPPPGYPPPQQQGYPPSQQQGYPPSQQQQGYPPSQQQGYPQPPPGAPPGWPPQGGAPPG